MASTNQNKIEQFLSELLADLVVRIQLSPSLYRRAVGHFEAIRNWIGREDSQLGGIAEEFYLQGSMATGSSISSVANTDEFDIDAMLELRLGEQVQPKAVLDMLYNSLAGAPGSQYHGKTKRKTRCVTITYADMHFDVTPGRRVADTPGRECDIFHHRREEPAVPGIIVRANPFGFAKWFQSREYRDDAFATMFLAKTSEYEQQLFLPALGIPSVTELAAGYDKSLTVVVLQLLKRWRNVQYDNRKGEKRPPSILLSKLVAEKFVPSESLFICLLHTAVAIREHFEIFLSEGGLIHECNPICIEDVLTDRWPEDLIAQRKFVGDLDLLIASLKSLETEERQEKILKVLKQLFGEQPTADLYSSYADKFVQPIRDGTSRHDKKAGAYVVAPLGVGVVPSSGEETKKHTFYGEDDK